MNDVKKKKKERKLIHHQEQNISIFSSYFIYSDTVKKLTIWDICTEFLPNSAPYFTIKLPNS